MINTKELGQIKVICIDAGRALLRFQKKVNKLKLINKSSEGFASEADIYVEKYIFKKLKVMFPFSNFLGEETYFSEFGLKTKKNMAKFSTKENCWVLDPLDGTSNFLKGSEYYCISLALVHKGKSEFGIIYSPRKKHLFYAIKGKGAYFQDLSDSSRPVKIFETRKFKLKNAIVALGYNGSKDLQISVLKNLAKENIGIRKFGSAALDLAYLSLGHFDVFIATNLSPWDVAAGEVILRESNHQLLDLDARVYNPFKSGIIASKKGLARRIHSIINGD